jgi:hypothetical protein
MPTLLISEEYGHRRWLAELTDEEYQTACNRWRTMRGLNCLVPVQLLFPNATPYWPKPGDPVLEYALHCHMHMHDDSGLDGVDYQIPDAPTFWIDGREYTDEDLLSLPVYS